MKKQVQKGFTLIELMIVVAIIGILASIALPAYQDYITKSKWSGVVAEMSPVKLAIAQCLQNNGNHGTACEAATDLGAYGLIAATSGGAVTMPTISNTTGAMTIGSGGPNGVVAIGVTGVDAISAVAGTGDTLTFTSGLDASGTRLVWAKSGTVPAKFVK